MRLLDFYMDTCQPCKKMDPIVKDVAEELGLDLEKVDAETAKAEPYNITNVPTFVVLDHNGKEIGRKEGMFPKTVLRKWLKGMMKENLPW